MIIRDTPRNLDKYIIIGNDDLAYDLQVEGFRPKFIDNNFIYFEKTDKLLNYLQGRRM